MKTSLGTNTLPTSLGATLQKPMPKLGDHKGKNTGAFCSCISQWANQRNQTRVKQCGENVVPFRMKSDSSSFLIDVRQENAGFSDPTPLV
jgi:hypothetical protein